MTSIADVEAKIRAEIAAAMAEPDGWNLVKDIYFVRSDAGRCGCALAACVRGRVDEYDRRGTIPGEAAKFLGISYDDAMNIVIGFDFCGEAMFSGPFAQLGARLYRELVQKRTS